METRYVLFDEHINQVIKMAKKMTKIIHRTFQCLDKNALLSLYKTIVTSHLNAITLWYPFKRRNLIL